MNHQNARPVAESLAYDALFALCQNRHSCRAFEPKHQLSDEDIEKIRALALTSPYASGKKNWDLLLVRENKTIKLMAQAIESHVRTLPVRPDFTDDFQTYARSFSAFTTASAIFVPTFRVSPSLSLMTHDEDDAIAHWEHDNAVKSISCVAMLVLLAVESLGLGACYMTGGLLAAEKLQPLIGVKPGRRIAAIIPVGLPAQHFFSESRKP